MRFRTKAANDPSLRWDIRDLDLWLECFPGTVCCLKLTAGLAIIVVVLRNIRLTVLFAPLLHTLLEDHNQLPPITSNEPTRYAETSTGPTVTGTAANSRTGVRSVLGRTPPRTAWQRGSPALVKPLRGPHYDRSFSNANYVTIPTKSLLDS